MHFNGFYFRIFSLKNSKTKKVFLDGNSCFGKICGKTSPFTYVSSNSPTIFTVHGTLDSVVPFVHAQLLQKRLKDLGGNNVLYKVPDRKHGNFTEEEMTQIYQGIWKFVAEIE